MSPSRASPRSVQTSPCADLALPRCTSYQCLLRFLLRCLAPNVSFPHQWLGLRADVTVFSPQTQGLKDRHTPSQAAAGTGRSLGATSSAPAPVKCHFPVRHATWKHAAAHLHVTLAHKADGASMKQLWAQVRDNYVTHWVGQGRVCCSFSLSGVAAHAIHSRILPTACVGCHAAASLVIHDLIRQ